MNTTYTERANKTTTLVTDYNYEEVIRNKSFIEQYIANILYGGAKERNNQQ